jgi:aspartate carbamoyltransferase catalytic subunit
MRQDQRVIVVIRHQSASIPQTTARLASLIAFLVLCAGEGDHVPNLLFLTLGA